MIWSASTKAIYSNFKTKTNNIHEHDNEFLSCAIPNTDTYDSYDDAVAETLSFALELLENKRNGWKKKWFKKAVRSLLYTQMK